MRITAAAPADLVYDCNQYAMALGFSEADGETYRGLNWQDSLGNLYAAASFDAREEWIFSAQSSLVRPEWDVNEIIDMDAAIKAQQSLIFYVINDEYAAPKANPLNLVAIAGCEGIEALSLMGLTTKLDEPMEE